MFSVITGATDGLGKAFAEEVSKYNFTPLHYCGYIYRQ